jgi:Sec-independent protein secretion pathway component TatC
MTEQASITMLLGFFGCLTLYCILRFVFKKTLSQRDNKSQIMISAASTYLLSLLAVMILLGPNPHLPVLMIFLLVPVLFFSICDYYIRN